MAKIGLAWDLGAGRGHAVRLATLARRVRERGDQPVLFARNLRTLRGAFDDDVPMLLPAPHNDWVPRDVAPASWADILWTEAGLHDGAQAQAIALAWRDVLAASGVQALLSDAAPLAPAAAAALGVRCIAIGTGFLVPPPGPPWPVFRDWGETDASRQATRGAQVADRVEGIRRVLGLDPGGGLPPGDGQALFTHRGLDHYPQRATDGVHYVGPILGRGRAPDWPDRGRRVFVYLPGAHPWLDAVRDALRAVDDLAVLAYLGGSVSAWDGATVSESPIDMATALAHAALVVTAGGNLAIAAAARGVPSLLLPTQAEAFLTATRLQSLGAAIVCTDRDALDAALRAALAPSMRDGAQALASALPVRSDDTIADRVLDLLR